MISALCLLVFVFVGKVAIGVLAVQAVIAATVLGCRAVGAVLGALVGLAFYAERHPATWEELLRRGRLVWGFYRLVARPGARQALIRLDATRSLILRADGSAEETETLLVPMAAREAVRHLLALVPDAVREVQGRGDSQARLARELERAAAEVRRHLEEPAQEGPRT